MILLLQFCQRSIQLSHILNDTLSKAMHRGVMETFIKKAVI